MPLSPDLRLARKPRPAPHPASRLASRLASRPAPKPRPAKPARSAFGALDRIVHERLRLGILSALAVSDSLTFNELKTLLEATDGNLSDHTRKLQLAGYIRVTKGYEGRKPQTEYALAPRGKLALKAYVDQMQSLLEETGAGLR